MASSNGIYDCLVIGAGPVGSFVASGLARYGHNVAVIERKQEIGSAVCCTGIISRECFDRYCADPGPIFKAANSAMVYGPSGNSIRLERDAVQAYIVDRGAFDRVMAERATQSGAHFFLASTVTGIGRGPDGIWVVRGRDLQWRARGLVLACGHRPAMTGAAGMGTIGRFLFAAQAEVTTAADDVEVYFDQRLAFGGFAWLVPTGNGRGLAGLMCERNGRSSFLELITGLKEAAKVKEQTGPVRQKTVPMASLPVTYGEGVIAVGEAAGQVKPSTGGGIFFGFLCGEVGVEVMHDALVDGDLSAARLASYERLWRGRIGRELALGHRVRAIYRQLNNHQLDRIISATESSRLVDRLLADRNFSFDYHSRMARKLLAEPGWLVLLLRCGAAAAAIRAFVGRGRRPIPGRTVARAFSSVL